MLQGDFMIIWINGSFGVGKTTIAENLKHRITNSIIYDPEKVGMFLYKTFPEKKDDFQDYKLWRMINYELLKNLDTKFEVIIVPMTITNLQYYDEIIGRLQNDGVKVLHFILTADKDKIIIRLNARGNSTEWAYRQVDRCVKAFQNNSFKGQKIDTNNKSIGEICNCLMKTIND